MPERSILCHPVDVLRRFDPTLTEADLGFNDYIGADDLDQVRARIDAVSADFEDMTGSPMRRGRMGSPGATETYEYQEVRNTRPSTPLWASLDNRPVIPFDSTLDDALEVRTGKDSWDDITDEEGDEFSLDNRSGRLKIYRWLLNRIYWGADDDRYLRACYRYGALGGSQSGAGETTLDGSITDSTTSVGVSNAARLPNRGVVLIANSEYVRITDVNYDTDTLTVERAVNATNTESHSDGDPVHYCPENIREAIAAKAATWAQEVDIFVDQLVETGEGFDAAARADRWDAEYESALAKHSEVRLL